MTERLEASPDKHFYWILFFSFLYFISCYAISISWYYSGYFNVYNIFFDSDPNTNLASFAHGHGRSVLTHAYLDLFSLPVRAIEWLFSNLLKPSSLVEFRELTSLAISPLFSAATLPLFYQTLKINKVNSFESSVFTLIFAASFSNIIFAIIPETYALSGFCIAVLIYYYFKCGEVKGYSRTEVWLVIALLLSGITITNICIFFLVYITHLYKKERLSRIASVIKATLVSALALLIVALVYKLSLLSFTNEPGSEGGGDWISRYLTLSLHQAIVNTINLFSASFNAFWSISPESLFRKDCGGSVCNWLSFIRGKRDLLLLLGIAITWLLFIYASIRPLKKNHWNDLYLVSALIIVYNFSLHAFFGREMFLYSQHWMIPLCLILVPVLSGKRLFSITLLVLLVMVNINFLLNVESLVALHVPV